MPRLAALLLSGAILGFPLPLGAQLPVPARSLTRQELGPLPRNASSKYLETVATAFAFDLPADSNTKDSGAMYSITLRAKRRLPPEALFLVQFENPESPESPLELERT